MPYHTLWLICEYVTVAHYGLTMESQAYTFSNELDNPNINYIQCIIKAYVENF